MEKGDAGLQITGMTEHEPPSATSASFAYKYTRLGSDAARTARGRALGSDLPNGYTTVAQAERIATLLEIAPDDQLLDLGSGRGWPGTHIADTSGCELVVADLPIVALKEARGRFERLDLLDRNRVVCADGRLLPFRESCFDAATHADVLC